MLPSKLRRKDDTWRGSCNTFIRHVQSTRTIKLGIGTFAVLVVVQILLAFHVSSMDQYPVSPKNSVPHMKLEAMGLIQTERYQQAITLLQDLEDMARPKAENQGALEAHPWAHRLPKSHVKPRHSKKTDQTPKKSKKTPVQTPVGETSTADSSLQASNRKAAEPLHQPNSPQAVLQSTNPGKLVNLPSSGNKEPVASVATEAAEVALLSAPGPAKLAGAKITTQSTAASNLEEGWKLFTFEVLKLRGLP